MAAPEGYDCTTQDAAKFLGVHVHTIRRWVDEGALPAYLTPGDRLRFRQVDLDQFVAERMVKPA